MNNNLTNAVDVHHTLPSTSVEITPTPLPTTRQRAFRDSSFSSQFPTVYKSNITINLFSDYKSDSEYACEDEIM